MSTSTRMIKSGRARTLALVPLRILAVVFLMFTGSFVARAQDPAPAPSPTPSARETRLTEQNRILELEKTNAELRKAIRDAQPQPSSTPLEGKTEADANVIIETQMVTYKAMSDVAERIGSQIHEKFGGAKAIAIYDEDELQNLKHSRAVMPVLNERIEGQKQKYWDVFSLINADPELRETEVTWDANKHQFLMSRSESAKFSIFSSDASKMSINADSISADVGGFVDVTGGIATGLKATADLLALMRTDTDIKGHSVTVEERALVAETFRSLRNKYSGINLYYPSLVPPAAKFECARGADPQTCSPFLQTIANLYIQKAWADKSLSQNLFRVTAEFGKVTSRKTGAAEEIGALAKKIDDLKLERLHAELEKPWTALQITKFENFIAELEARKAAAIVEKKEADKRLEVLSRQKDLLERLQSLNQQADEMIASLTTPDEKSGRSELANILRAENINHIMENDGYWLEFKAVNAGGNNRTRKNLFRFFSGAKIDHSGGVIIEWALYDRDGVSVESNKDSSYPGYFAPKEIQSGKLKDAVADPNKPATPAVAKTGNQ